MFIYKDVTDEFIINAISNSHRVRINNYFIDCDAIKHPIRGKEKAIPTIKDSIEYKRSLWLEEIFGGKIYNVPRIIDISNSGLSTPTPDYIWNAEKWDLKTPSKNGQFKNTLERFVKKKESKLQAKKYIIDFVNFDDKTDKEILEVIKKNII